MIGADAFGIAGGLDSIFQAHEHRVLDFLSLGIGTPQIAVGLYHHAGYDVGLHTMYEGRVGPCRQARQHEADE